MKVLLPIMHALAQSRTLLGLTGRHFLIQVAPEPAVSVPSAKHTSPAPTAAPEPDDEPPGKKRSSKGFRGVPYGERVPTRPAANWSMLVLPTITPPAAPHAQPQAAHRLKGPTTQHGDKAMKLNINALQERFCGPEQAECPKQVSPGHTSVKQGLDGRSAARGHVAEGGARSGGREPGHVDVVLHSKRHAEKLRPVCGRQRLQLPTTTIPPNLNTWQAACCPTSSSHTRAPDDVDTGSDVLCSTITLQVAPLAGRG